MVLTRLNSWTAMSLTSKEKQKSAQCSAPKRQIIFLWSCHIYLSHTLVGEVKYLFVPLNMAIKGPSAVFMGAPASRSSPRRSPGLASHLATFLPGRLRVFMHSENLFTFLMLIFLKKRNSLLPRSGNRCTVYHSWTSIILCLRGTII